MKSVFKFHQKRCDIAFPIYQLIITTLIFIVCYSANSQSIVEQHGRLRVINNRVVDKNNAALSLAGNSIFWSNFSEGAKFYNAQTVNHIATDWKSDIIRAAMGVENPGGYISNPTREKNKVKAVVNAAINASIYVIIDWHSHNAEQYESQAVAFFSEMAELYGDNDHVIYEVYNEPIAQSWSTIKNYSEAIIRAIRAKDPDNLIIVGSSQWSQKVVEASNNPINDPNVAYALHFYSGTHKQFLRNEASRAMANGIALFVTEWGAVNSNGDGTADRAETQRWLDFMKSNGISHANWSISDKAEGASVVASNTGIRGLINNNLTTTGEYIKGIIENWNTVGGSASPTEPTPPLVDGCTGSGLTIANKIEAENYCAQKGIRKEPTQDTGGGQNIGYIDNGDYLKYRIAIPENATYTITYRVASIVSSGRLQFKSNTTNLKTITIPNTGAWQNWMTIETEVNLQQGSKTFELFAQSGRFNINWFKISKKQTDSPNPPSNNDDCTFGLPINNALPSTGNASYTNIHLIGASNLNLNNVTNFTVNWDLANNDLYQFSMNTNNGNPNWWIDLKKNASYDFNSTQPSITLNSTGFANLDGTYWVGLDGDNFIMRSANRDFTIYFSNQDSTPNCATNGTKILDLNPFNVYPVPTKNILTINGLSETSTVNVLNMQGSIVFTETIYPNNASIDISTLSTGHYFLQILSTTPNNFVKTIPFIKE
ncbi:cellulase family glycosylhydrolase [Aquimarina agarivorans]|uniref:cellulase family glycosylhydrolase n=1 Tax=Aquimarina agarivorans TaxID=980584 RepID=UPI000248F5D4|nr:cellulase family glycosylhydrolase [Aquimarina agarivorans]